MISEEILESLGDDLDVCYSHDHWNALQLACGTDDVEVARHLLAEGADANRQHKSMAIPRVTPLHIACRVGDLDLVKLLLPHADINIQDQWGFTPLHYAVVARKKDVVLHLLSNGASSIITSKAGTTAGDIATHMNFEDVADALKSKLNLEADPTVPQFRSWLTHLGAGEYLKGFLEAGYDLRFVAQNGLTDADLDCVGIPAAKMGLRRKIAQLHALEQFYSPDEADDDNDGDGDDGEEEDDDDDDADEDDEDDAEESD